MVPSVRMVPMVADQTLWFLWGYERPRNSFLGGEPLGGVEGTSPLDSSKAKANEGCCNGREKLEW